MRIKGRLATGLLVALILTLIPITAYSVQKPTPGSACKVYKQKVTYQSKVFTCIKSSKKLVWNKGVAVKKATPTPIPTPTLQGDKYAEPSIPTLTTDRCKIEEVSSRRISTGVDYIGSGFPMIEKYVKHSGTVNWVLIPIDFMDLEGEPGISKRVENQTQLVTDWYMYVSSGRFNVNWTVMKKWIRLPGLSTDYAVPKSGAYPETTNFWRKAIQKVDEEVDLTNVTNIVFVLPQNQTIVPISVQSFPWMPEMQTYNSKKGKILSFSLAGKNFSDSRFWSYWAHEFGHVIGLAHVGSSYLPWGEFSMYDLLGHQDGPTKELSGWMRFIAGWLEDKQVFCQNINGLSQVSLSLRPLSSADPDLKLAVIKISENLSLIHI